MSKYFTIEHLYSLERSGTVEDIIRTYTDISDKDFLGVLAYNYQDLLLIWANDNGVSISEVFDHIEMYLNEQNKFRIIEERYEDDLVITELNLNNLALHMYWDVELDG